MQVSRMVQAVALMLIVALAASCAASKEYSSKLFKPRTEPAIDSQTAALRFLEMDKLDPDTENWVSTDIIMGRDTASGTTALDNLAKILPAKQLTKDTSVVTTREEKTIIVLVEKKAEPVSLEPKKTDVANPVIAKNDNSGVRNKRTREEKNP